MGKRGNVGSEIDEAAFRVFEELCKLLRTRPFCFDAETVESSHGPATSGLDLPEEGDLCLMDEMSENELLRRLSRDAVVQRLRSMVCENYCWGLLGERDMVEIERICVEENLAEDGVIDILDPLAGTGFHGVLLERSHGIRRVEMSDLSERAETFWRSVDTRDAVAPTASSWWEARSSAALLLAFPPP